MGMPRLVEAHRNRAVFLTALGAVTAAVVAVCGYLALPIAARALVVALDLMMQAAIWLAASGRSGASVSTILLTVARAMNRALTSTEALVVLACLAAVGGIALYGLQ